MAEAFLRHLGNGTFEAESAGLEKGILNPYAISVMQEIGIDISRHETKEIFDLYKQGRHYQAVISVCDETNGEKSPIYPGVTKRIRWSFANPSKFGGTEEEIMAQTKAVRDQIREKVIEFIDQASSADYWLTQQDH